jgi:RimJ/RimL family protein N-acetyltransferase
MLIGTSTTLRAWTVKDAHNIQKLKNDVYIQTQLMGVPKPNSINKILNWLKSRDKDENMVFFIIAKSSDDEAIGYVQISNIDKINQFGYLGICLAKEFWGSGYAKESLNLLIEYAISILSLRKILLLVRNDNHRAINFYKKVGFEVIGTLKNHHLIQGVWTDVLMMERVMT